MDHIRELQQITTAGATTAGATAAGAITAGATAAGTTTAAVTKKVWGSESLSRWSARF